MNRNGMNLSPNSDEYSILDFQKQSPKTEYSRSQLIELGNAAHGHSKVAINPMEEDQLARLKLARSKPRNVIDSLTKKGNVIDSLTKKAVTIEAKQNLNDNFWGTAKTTGRNATPETFAHKFDFEFDFQSAMAKAKMDDRFDLPFNTNSKVDRWLSSGQDPTEYATASAEFVADPIQIPYTKSASNDFKFNEDSSFVTDVSAKSAMRSKLLDKTAKLKQNLRNKTQNKN